jgi:hypothetical protein
MTLMSTGAGTTEWSCDPCSPTSTVSPHFSPGVTRSARSGSVTPLRWPRSTPTSGTCPKLSAPSVPTTFVGADDPIPELRGEVVVKPNVSAGARNTGRFSPATYREAFALIDRIRAGGDVALVQPYMSSVDTTGETAFVFFGDALSHVLRKRAVLRPDEVAPVAREGFPHELGVAQAMLDDDLVFAGEASPAEHALAERVFVEVAETFGTALFLRVDLVRDSTGAAILMEIEAIDPLFYFALAPGASARFAAAVRAN